MQTCIDSIFPEGHDVNTCIFHAADSIGLKDVPNYEVKKGEQYDWIRKTQVTCYSRPSDVGVNRLFEFCQVCLECFGFDIRGQFNRTNSLLHFKFRF